MVRAQQRTDVVSYTLLAEMSYFHQQRVHDFNAAAKIFLQEQITYYQKVTHFYFRTLIALKLLLYADFVCLFFRLSIICSPLYPSTRMSKKLRSQYRILKLHSFFKLHSFMRINEFSPNYFGILVVMDFIWFSFLWETFPQMV